MSKNNTRVVIVGGSYAGLTALKYVRSMKNIDITLVSNCPKFWNNIAAPKLLARSDTINTVEREFIDIQPTVESAGGKFIHGNVTSINFEDQLVILQAGDHVCYDYLILATGSRTELYAFKYPKGEGDYKRTIDTIKTLNKKIELADTIAVAGGGATGVETAAHLAAQGKTVFLICSSPHPLPMLREETYNTSQILTKIGVNVLSSTKVDKVIRTGDGSVQLDCSNDQLVVADVYLPCTGVKPNTQYLKQEDNVVDGQGYVVVDDYLRVKGKRNVYAFGDIVSGGERTTLDIVYRQGPVLKSALNRDIKHKRAPKQTMQPSNSGRPTIVVSLPNNRELACYKGVTLPPLLRNRVVKRKSYYV